MDKEFKHLDKTKKVIEIFYEVYNYLGYGFLESVYKKAIIYELKKNNFKIEAEKSIEVFYKGTNVGQFFADVVVDDLIIVELKAVKKLKKCHEAQLLNYLNATEYEVGLLFNFGPEPEINRKAYDNERKKYKNDSK
ncbi:MAG: GxxExxY protein [bacterium]